VGTAVDESGGGKDESEQRALQKHTNYLDLDVDLDQLLRQRIDADKTGVNCAVEATKFGDETNVSLMD
jgi:hypothetical protein